MRKAANLIIISILFLIMLGGTIAGCTVFPTIAGKWQDTQTQNTIEFTRAGEVIIKSGNFITTGTYELVGSDVVKLKLEGIGALIGLFGGDTWEYKISGNTMTVKVAGKTSELKRIAK